MFRKFLEFLKRIFNKNQSVKMLEAKIEPNYTDVFKKEVQYDNGKKGKDVLQEIINEKKHGVARTQEELSEIQEKLVDYINVLIKQIDKCQSDIAIKRMELSNLGNKN